MDLRNNDYINGAQSLRTFKTQRLFSINKNIREQIVVAIEIQHNDVAPTQFFYIPGKLYHLYLNNKNYLSIFSREGLNNYLHDCLPRSNELLSEKNVTFRNIFSFQVVEPNTLLSMENERETENCYAIVSGSIKVFKHDSGSS